MDASLGEKLIKMDKDTQWQELIRSMNRAARILNIDLTEKDIPEYLDWYTARKIHRSLWNQVYLKKRK